MNQQINFYLKVLSVATLISIFAGKVLLCPVYSLYKGGRIARGRETKLVSCVKAQAGLR